MVVLKNSFEYLVIRFEEKVEHRRLRLGENINNDYDGPMHRLWVW